MWSTIVKDVFVNFARSFTSGEVLPTFANTTKWHLPLYNFSGNRKQKLLCSPLIQCVVRGSLSSWSYNSMFRASMHVVYPTHRSNKNNPPIKNDDTVSSIPIKASAFSAKTSWILSSSNVQIPICAFNLTSQQDNTPPASLTFSLNPSSKISKNFPSNISQSLDVPNKIPPSFFKYFS